MEIKQALHDKINLLPDTPGVYIYYDKKGDIIYVGKAKRLRRRVMSYFNREHTVLRTNILVRNIVDLKYIVVGSEEDALHLENSLIKEHKPRYNVLLKDDKSYPWIVVTNEPFPRVFMTREQPLKGRGKYYGPYTNIQIAKTIISLIREIYPVRSCKHLITPDTVKARKHSLCLEYHIKNCEGCCIGEVSGERYNEYITEIKQILSGNTQQLSELLKEQMGELAAEFKFEQAQAVKERFLLIEKYRAKSVVAGTQIADLNIFSLVRDEDSAYLNYMHVRGGAIVQSLSYEYRCKLEETDAELLSYGIAEIHARFNNKSKETVVPFLPDAEFSDTTFIVPQKGDKRKLLDISLQNAKQYKLDKLKQSEKLNPEQRTTRLLTSVQRDFRLKSLPYHIECFDNSNTQGTNPVSSCVVFRNGKPSKRDYRHYNVKTVVGADDYATMVEVVYRRYKRLSEETPDDLPDLIIVDGGKGQLSSALTALGELGLRGKIAIAGIAKRLEEIYFPGDSVPLYIDKNSESLRLIQHMRDEAHRFGITHHRNRRSKGQIQSELDDIKGIGVKSKEMLLKRFKSLKRVREATAEELAELLGVAKAKILIEYFNNNKQIEQQEE